MPRIANWTFIVAIVATAIGPPPAVAQSLPQVRLGFTQREIELWMVKLDLSEGQSKYLQDQFDSYQVLRSAANESVGDEYRAARRSAMNLASTQYSVGRAEAFDEAFRLSDRVSAAVAVFDQHFVSAVQESLSDEQQELFSHLLTSHERYVYRNEVALHPEIGVDLVEFFEPITSAEIAEAKHTVGGLPASDDLRTKWLRPACGRRASN